MGLDKTSRKFLQNELMEHEILSQEELSALSNNVKQLAALASSMDKIDPRMSKKTKYSASLIMSVALMGVFAGAQTWNQIANYGNAKLNIINRFFPKVKNTPSHDTLRRFFMIVKPESLEGIYREWAKSFQDAVYCDLSNSDSESEQFAESSEESFVERHHYAIDGKTICGAIDPEKLYEANKDTITREQAEHAKLHMVSIYNTECGISMGQERVEVKENELAAIPKLLDSLDLGKGDIVTIDAMGTHTNFAEKIVNAGADYIFEVKENQKNLKKHIELCMDTFLEHRERTKLYDAAEEILTDHSQKTHRQCFVYKYDNLMKECAKKWPGFRTFGVIITTKTKNDGTSLTENHYFITSLPRDPALIMKHKREHWQVENALHWHLDVIFNEDKGRKMMNSAQNYSLLTKMALAILKKDKKKMAMTDKRLLAGWDDKYMYSLVNQFIANF